MIAAFFAVAVIGQSAVNVQIVESDDNYYQYFLHNVRLGEPGMPMVFRLSVAPSINAVSIETNPTSTFWKSFAFAGATDRVVFPGNKFKAVFDAVGASENVLSMSSLSLRGVTLCKEELYIGPPPSACMSVTYASALCDEEGCWHDIKRTAGHSVAKFNAELPYMPTDCSRAKLITSNADVDICVTARNEFNLAPSHVAIHMISPEHQILFVNDSGTSNLEGTIFAFAIVLIMIVWTANSTDYIALRKNKINLTNLTLTLCDVVVTASTASVFAVIRSGESFCPAETSQALGKYGGVISISFTVVSVVLGSFLATIFMFAALRATISKHASACMLCKRTRCLVETVLMLILHTHFPNAMGQTLRRSVGFFVGCTSAAVIGRDSDWVSSNKHIFATAMYCLWSAFALGTITINLLLPITYVSAGFSNASAPLVACTIVVVAASAGVAYSNLK